MSEPIAPDGLAAALHGTGLVLAGPLGTGHQGVHWTARSADGVRWAVTVVDVRSPGHAQHLEQRAARLRALEHPHLARTGPTVPLPGDRLAAVRTVVPGTDLSTVLLARSTWSAAEVVGVVVALAGALEVLHGAGLAHGDVSPANVVVAADGRPVLVDLLSSDDLRVRGTPGVAAPERRRGARPPGDVHALARTGLLLLGSAADHGGETAQGTDEVARLAAVLRDAACPDPAARPSAAELGRRVAAVCPAAPVLLPDAAVLARLALQRLTNGAHEDRTRTVTARGRRRGRHRRRHRAPRTVVAGMAVGACLAVAAFAVVALGPAAGAGPGTWLGGLTGAEGPGDDVRPPAPVAPLSVDAAEAAVRLTTARVDALARQDEAGLAAVTVPGSPAAQADAEALARARARGGPQALTVDVREVSARSGQDADPDGSACVLVDIVAVVDARPPGDATAAPSETGEGPSDGAGSPGRAVQEPVTLHVCPTSDGWRVSAVDGR